MAIIDVEEMYRVMRDSMEDNLTDSSVVRFKKAKKLFLDSVADLIDHNRSDLIKEMRK